MPRNSSGTMTLPSPGVPFQSGQVISSAQVNATLTDLATETTSSLDRGGRGGMTAPLRVPDGTVAAPAVAFVAEINSGWYRAGAGDVRLTIGGVDFITPNGIAFPGSGGFGPVLSSTVSGKSVTVLGNLTAASGAADVQIGTTATRTAGFIAAFQNPINTGNKLLVDYNGLLTLAAPAAAIQPAAIWTAITPNAGWTAAILDTGYHKDALGFVHVRGGLTNNTGAASGSVITTNPLPIGFRPGTFRLYAASVGSATPVPVTMNADGTITTPLPIPNGGTVYLDVIHFMAQQ